MENDCENDEFNLQEIFNFWDSQRSSQLAGTPSSTGVNQTSPPDSITRNSSASATPRALSLQQSNARKLTFIEELIWDPEKRYDADPPLYICYSIEWTVTAKLGTVNRRKISNDMELNVVLAPGRYWECRLQARLADLVKQKFAGNPNVRPDDTEVVVSMTGRSQHKLVKRFPGIDIDWTIVQAQLEAWSEYLRSGKRLRVILSFNYIQVGVSAADVGGKRGDKRGRVSTTTQMRNELDLRVEAEQATSGQQSHWRKVYGLFRCPGSPCALGPHCWIDPVGKKHYRLLTHHLKELVRFVERRGKLETHEDVPPFITQQLYAEEQQKRDRKSGKVTGNPGGSSTVTINILPGHSQQAVLASGQARSVGPVQIFDSSVDDDLNIDGPRDVAVKEFSTWLQAQYEDSSYQEEVRKAEKAMLDERFGLLQVYGGRNSEFLASKGVKRGVADSFMNDIPVWNKRRRVNQTGAEGDKQFEDGGSPCIM